MTPSSESLASSVGGSRLTLYARRTGRVMLGATNPLSSAPGTIRGDYALDMGRVSARGPQIFASLPYARLLHPERLPRLRLGRVGPARDRPLVP